MSFLSKTPWVAAWLPVLASTFSLATADEVNQSSAFVECAALQDDASRLECFDSAVSALQPALEPEAPAPAVSSQPVDSPPAAPAVAAAAVIAPADAPAKPAETPVDEFGMNASLASSSPDNNKPEELTEISAKVTDVRKRPYGELVVTLENGQVWTEKESEHGFRIKEGDTITIRHGTFGGYRMITRSNRSSQVVRVK